MNRMKIYDLPHMALRNALSQLSLLAGQTDYANVTEVNALHALGKDVWSLLTIHAHDEDHVTLAALELRCAGSTAHDHDDHERLHDMQQHLEEQLNSLCTDLGAGKDVQEAGSAFYLALSEFHGSYLLHIAQEERLTQPLLWQYFTDDELMEHRKRIMASNPPATLLTWFRFALPALPVWGRISLLSGFRQMSDNSSFQQALDVARTYLPAGDDERLIAALS